MDKTSKALVLEARTILYILHSIAEGSADWDEDIPRQEMVHLLYLAKVRLDEISCVDLSLH